MCNGSNWSFSIFIMTYNIFIDQRFAVANELTIVQATTLAACMTLPIWTKTITIDAKVWYQYSEVKMVEDFPLLFSIPKRVYKNMKELADRGFIELSSFGKTKYLRFTEKCKTWNRSETDYNQSENGLHDNINNNQSENGLHDNINNNQSENGLRKPKTDYNQSENGLHNYNINNYNINNYNNKPENKFPDFFDGNQQYEQPQKLRGTTEPHKCLFANSRFSKFEDFEKCFDKPEFEKIDILYYYHSVADWSASKGRMQKDWIAQTRNFIRGDKEKGKLHLKPEYSKNESKINISDAVKFLNDDF